MAPQEIANPLFSTSKRQVGQASPRVCTCGWHWYLKQIQVFFLTCENPDQEQRIKRTAVFAGKCFSCLLHCFSLRSWRDSWAGERWCSTGLFTNPLTALPLAFTASLPKQKHSSAKSRQLRRLALFIPLFSFARKKFVTWSGTKGYQLKNIFLWWRVFKKLFVFLLSSALGKTIKRTVGKQK